MNLWYTRITIPLFNTSLFFIRNKVIIYLFSKGFLSSLIKQITFRYIKTEIAKVIVLVFNSFYNSISRRNRLIGEVIHYVMVAICVIRGVHRTCKLTSGNKSNKVCGTRITRERIYMNLVQSMGLTVAIQSEGNKTKQLMSLQGMSGHL